jgi:uncharacterized protein (TIGR02300 family)
MRVSDAIDTGPPSRQGEVSLFSLQGFSTVAKSELGTKRLCASCGAKFYDLNHDPITCPKCGVVYEPVAPRGGRPDTGRAPAQEVEPAEPQGAEFISLEEADAEAQGKKKTVGEEIPDVEDEVEMDENLDDAAFIEETEEEDADVSDILGGDIEDEEET